MSSLLAPGTPALSAQLESLAFASLLAYSQFTPLLKVLSLPELLLLRTLVTELNAFHVA